MPEEANPKSITENTTSIALDLSRRDFVTTASAAAGGFALTQGSARAATVHTDITNLPPYGNGTLPPGIRSRRIANVNGLTVHILEAGYEVPGRPAVLLLHGFPELAYSWRSVMLPLAAAEYHVIAPDQRGYGRTTGWDDSYDADPDPFRILNMVRDAMGLVFALGYREVAGVVGHDAGSPVAAWSALIRPDVFRSVTMMSSPFAGVPSLPFNTANGAPPPRPTQTDDELVAELAKLSPPREVGDHLDICTFGHGTLLELRMAIIIAKSAVWCQGSCTKSRSGFSATALTNYLHECKDCVTGRTLSSGGNDASILSVVRSAGTFLSSDINRL